jgi:hypothetical protein
MATATQRSFSDIQPRRQMAARPVLLPKEPNQLIAQSPQIPLEQAVPAASRHWVGYLLTAIIFTGVILAAVWVVYTNYQ